MEPLAWGFIQQRARDSQRQTLLAIDSELEKHFQRLANLAALRAADLHDGGKRCESPEVDDLDDGLSRLQALSARTIPRDIRRAISRSTEWIEKIQGAQSDDLLRLIANDIERERMTVHSQVSGELRKLGPPFFDPQRRNSI